MAADFRRFYGTAFQDAARTWPVRELTDSIRNLPLESATVRAELGDRFDWGHLAANVATLVDLLTYQVNADYMRAITDPDDLQVKRELEQRRRDGIKPPPFPLIPPAAFRPESVAVEYDTAFQELLAEHGTPEPGTPTTSGAVRPGKHVQMLFDTDRVDRLLARI